MALAEELNIEQVAQEVTNTLYERMVADNMAEAEVHFNANILFEFAKIAGSLILQEPGVEDPATQAFLDFDLGMARQTIELFCEGTYFSAMKCRDFGINDEIKSQLLQSVAQDIFTQAKQIVVSTYNQEATPEFQISKDQQDTWINQTAETALMYYINQYESQYGPIVTQQPGTKLSPIRPFEESDANEEAFPPEASVSTPQALPIPKTPQKGPTPHDKYAAVALLLTTLRQNQQESILQRFNAEERELIHHYSNPEQIEQSLDLSCVHHHLLNFKALIHQGSASLKNKTVQAFETMAHHIPQAALLEPLQKERPVLQQYIASYYKDSDEEAVPIAKQRGLSFSISLPPQVEEVLYQYLSRKLDWEEAET